MGRAEIDLAGRTLLTPAGLWTIRVSERLYSVFQNDIEIVRLELSCGDAWHFVDVHVDRVAHVMEHRADVGWILDALRSWLMTPDAAKPHLLVLGRRG